MRISELEERIADRREFFNDDVNTYNTRIGQIPEVFVASFMSLKPRAMFKVSDEDRKLVEVKFQGAAGAERGAFLPEKSLSYSPRSNYTYIFLFINSLV